MTHCIPNYLDFWGFVFTVHWLNCRARITIAPAPCVSHNQSLISGYRDTLNHHFTGLLLRLPVYFCIARTWAKKTNLVSCFDKKEPSYLFKLNWLMWTQKDSDVLWKLGRIISKIGTLSWEEKWCRAQINSLKWDRQEGHYLQSCFSRNTISEYHSERKNTVRPDARAHL